ncbi:hypothetical protein [Mastigocoleus sp. MO_188.B34]|uniref:hypothetical protein n=1 Tax=Mastigocoleus sp. MO_188.B34 TaxID=3036635 RepID=UPI002606BE90|nr:hypothetical protein [Mastigocoleus sp. MO_188.B34]MDJ0694906.1 hypothetical protein [Mastigocoleus sp. MO_188.B34]
MWKNATKLFSVGGKVKYPTSGGVFEPLQGVSVDIYRVIPEEGGFLSFLRLNSLPAITNSSGDFTFTDLPVEVQTEMATPAGSPGTPIEIVQPTSLPDIVFLISGQGGTEYVEIYDERNMVDEAWSAANPIRVDVPLTGSPVLTVDIPELSPTASVSDDQFYFLRVGRVTRDEITNVSDPDPGYMTSAASSFFSGIVDAPFGGTLHIGGHFGNNIRLQGDNIYYRLYFSPYSGNPAAPFDLTSATQITNVLDNKKYIFPTSAGDPGRWEKLSLGPFTAQVVGGSSIQVYRRPPLYNPAVEYMPFPDLIVKWDSTAADNDLVILAIEVYKKTGEVGGIPQLTPIALVPTVNKYEFLPLRIDNRPPVPKINSWETSFATFSPQSIGSLTTNECGEMEVEVGDLNGNECMVLGYSIEDGSGSAHRHLSYYRIRVEYSPRQPIGVIVPSTAQVRLKGQESDPTFHAGVGKKDIDWNYDPTSDPVHSNIWNYSSVLVPQTLDGWPPEPAGDTYGGVQCLQYAAEVSLGCGVRTINGWSRLFGHRHTSRHIIIKKLP